MEALDVNASGHNTGCCGEIPASRTAVVLGEFPARTKSQDQVLWENELEIP